MANRGELILLVIAAALALLMIFAYLFWYKEKQEGKDDDDDILIIHKGTHLRLQKHHISMYWDKMNTAQKDEFVRQVKKNNMNLRKATDEEKVAMGKMNKYSNKKEDREQWLKQKITPKSQD
jgi:hypothetical protein